MGEQTTNAGAALLWLATALTLHGCCYTAGPAPAPTPPPRPAPPSGVPRSGATPPPERPTRPRDAGHLDEASLAAYAGSLARQAPDPRSLYDTSVPHDGVAPIERGMLVCRATVRGGGYDPSLFAGGADVALRVRIGTGEVRRTADSSLRMYTFPVARLTRGDAFWVRVVDRDILFDDTIAEGNGTYANAPFVLGMEDADVECRVAPQASVDRGAQTAISALARAAEQLGEVTPDLSANDLGYPRVQVDAALHALDGALAWVEFTDVALQEQVRRLVAFEDGWRVRLTDALGEATRSLPEPGAAQELPSVGELRVAALECGREADALRRELPPDRFRHEHGCIITLELTTTRPLTLEPSGRVRILETSALMSDASRVDAQVIWRRVEGEPPPPMSEAMPVAGGTTVTLLVESVAPTAPTLLRVRRGGPTLLLRVQ